jgi:hypothetical protein
LSFYEGVGVGDLKTGKSELESVFVYRLYSPGLDQWDHASEIKRVSIFIMVGGVRKAACHNIYP